MGRWEERVEKSTNYLVHHGKGAWILMAGNQTPAAVSDITDHYIQSEREVIFRRTVGEGTERLRPEPAPIAMAH